MQQYEVAVLYHPDLEVDLTKAEDRIKKVFADNKGKIVATDNWGKKKLAYPINGSEYAVYVFYTVELEPASLRKIEGVFNITDELLRYLIVRVDTKELAKAEAARVAKEKKQAEASEDKEGSSNVKDKQAPN